MSYCINPNCPKPADPLHDTNRICRHCGSQLVLEGRYRALRLLGEGGFAKTYEASDFQSQNKVLKVLLLSEKKAVTLFKKEAEILMRLSHPGIPKVEADAYFTYLPKHSNSPLHCLVMEKINGPNLEQWLYSRNYQPLSQPEAINWLQQLTTILHEVHASQFFHRDIKPANIMLRPNGQLVLIDFGSAREVTGTYLAKMGVGQKNTVIASKGYTPPEQDSGHPVPQSDFFALGRTFVHLLTGSPPLDFYDQFTDQLKWHSAAPQISAEFANFIDSLMARLPGHRPPNTEVILQRLAEINRPVTRVPVQKQSNFRFDKLLKDNVKWAAAGVFVIGGTTALGAIYSFTDGPSTPKRQPISANVIKTAETPTLQPTYSRPAITNFNQNVEEKKIGLAATLAGHSLDVRSLAITPDSRTLASGSLDGTIKIWNLQTGQIIRTLTAHSEAQELVASVAISSDGKTLVSGSNSYGGTIKIWNLNSGELLITLPKQVDGVSVVAISPDSKIIASGSEDMTVKLWDAGTGTQLNTLYGHTGPIRAVAFSPDGKLIASSSEDTTIKLWNRNNSELMGTLVGHTGNVHSIAFTPDGQTLASASADNTIKLWNLRTGCTITQRCYATTTFSSHSGTLYSIAFSPDGQILAGGGLAGRVSLWNINSGELLQTLPGHSRWVESVVFSPDGKILASGSGDSSVKIWQMP